MAFNRIYDIAGSAMRAQTVRLDTVASNLANADSVSGSEETAFRAIKPVFATLYQRVQEADGMASAQVQIAGVTQSDRPVQKRLEPDNPLADGDGYVYTANVNPVEEMVNLTEATRAFDANVAVVRAARNMALSAQDLLRVQ